MRAHRIDRWLLLFAMAVGAWMIASSNAHGGSGNVIRTPPPSVRRNLTGLKLTIDTQWVDASGYRDVRIHVATATGVPSPRDRELLVELAPHNYGYSEGKFVVKQFVTLSQGATGATAHMLVPQNQPWQQLVAQVSVDGRPSKQLSSDTGLNNSTGRQWSEAIPAILVIDADAPTLLARHDKLARFNRSSRGFPREEKLLDIRGWEALVERSEFFDDPAQRVRDMELLRRISNTPRLEMLPPEDLPQRWLGLSCFDLIIIDRADLAGMSQSNRAKFDALLDWTATGGTLLVFGVGDTYENLNALEELLALRLLTDDGHITGAGWTAADSRRFNDRPVRRFQSMESYDRWYGATTEAMEEDGRPRLGIVSDAFATSHKNKFLTRPLGMGMVLAMASENPFPGSTTEWSWVLNTMGEGRSMWYRRQGLSLRRQNEDFWDFLVPDTGKAPVIEFCLLITLFAIVIGPVNYFFLARQRRLYMLLLTIPGGAALVTFSLVFYAVVADGLGTQARVRSYTLLDQNSARAVNWSRQSYYAGLAPSRGLTFPNDTVVYAIEQFPTHEEDERSLRQRVVQWGEEGQNLRSGYLSSRVTAQFLTMRTEESTASLQLDQRTSPANARNRLGGKIRLLLLRDAAGAFFTANDVPDGERVSLKPDEFAEMKDNIFKAIIAARPSEPQGLDSSQLTRRRPNRWRGWNFLDDGLSDARCGTNLMEDRIRRIQNWQEKDFPSATYIAIIESSSITPLGVPASESGSLHVVEGKF